MVDLPKLIAMLKEIDTDKRIKEQEYVNEDIDTHYPKFGSLLDNAIITKDGKPNFTSIDTLAKAGYKVGPSETDSFGWLTSFTRTKKGMYIL